MNGEIGRRRSRVMSNKARRRPSWKKFDRKIHRRLLKEAWKRFHKVIQEEIDREILKGIKITQTELYVTDEEETSAVR